MAMLGPTTVYGSVNVTGEVTASSFNSTSSVRYKENIRELVLTDTLDYLQPVRYTRKENGKEEIGFIAEEVNKLYPEIIHFKDGVVEGIDYSKITAILAATVKTQNDRISQLESQVNLLISKLTD